MPDVPARRCQSRISTFLAQFYSLWLSNLPLYFVILSTLITTGMPVKPLAINTSPLLNKQVQVFCLIPFTVGHPNLCHR